MIVITEYHVLKLRCLPVAGTAGYATLKMPTLPVYPVALMQESICYT